MNVLTASNAQRRRNRVKTLRCSAARWDTIAVAFFVLTLLLGGSAGAQTPIAVRIATLPIDAEAEPLYAQELGFFKKAGLDVTVTIATSAGAIAAATLGGTFDVGVTDVGSITLAHEKGLPLVFIAPAALYVNTAPTTVCVVAKSSPVKSAKDLSGSTIGVTSLFGLTRIAFDAWLDKSGGDSTSVKFVELPFSEIAPALVAGRIAAGSISNPYLQTAVDAGQVRVLSDCYNAVAPKLLLNAFFTTTDFAIAHPDVVKKIAAVVAETARWANTHHAASARIIEDQTKVKMTSDMARATYAEVLSAAQIQPQIDAAVRSKVLKATFPASDLFAPGVGGK